LSRENCGKTLLSSSPVIDGGKKMRQQSIRLNGKVRVGGLLHIKKLRLFLLHVNIDECRIVIENLHNGHPFNCTIMESHERIAACWNLVYRKRPILLSDIAVRVVEYNHIRLFVRVWVTDDLNKSCLLAVSVVFFYWLSNFPPLVRKGDIVQGRSVVKWSLRSLFLIVEVQVEMCVVKLGVIVAKNEVVANVTNTDSGIQFAVQMRNFGVAKGSTQAFYPLDPNDRWEKIAVTLHWYGEDLPPDFTSLQALRDYDHSYDNQKVN
jgi:hypothetical protein